LIIRVAKTKALNIELHILRMKPLFKT